MFDGADAGVGLAQEVGHEAGAGQVVELGRRTELLDVALVHHRDGVGHRHGLLLVVGDVDEGEPDLGLDALELDLHLAAQLEVERAERLVEQQHLGVVDQRAGQCHALLLAAGELVGLAPGELRHLHELEGVVGPGGGVLLLAALGPEGDVVADRQVREEGVGLEDGVDRPLVGPRAGQVGLPDHHPAGRGLLQPGDHPQGGGLAAARRTEQGEEGAPRDVEVNAVDGDEVTEGLGHALEPEVAAGFSESGHVSSPSRCWTTGRRTRCPRRRSAPGTAGCCCRR